MWVIELFSLVKILLDVSMLNVTCLLLGELAHWRLPANVEGTRVLKRRLRFELSKCD